MKNNCGQTIIEVVVALTIIILFLSGIVVLQITALKNAEYAQNKSIATQLARQQMERARVVRDSAGISALLPCLEPLSCYINTNLTPVPVIPTGFYGQSLTISNATVTDCGVVATVTPVPVSYKVTANISFRKITNGTTPVPDLVLTSCLTDWR
jgi:type II secretory pathway pseudopilin PulG